VVVRHSGLVLDYTAAISYRPGFFALSGFGGVYDTRLELMMHYGLKTGNRFFLTRDEVTEVSLYMFDYLALSFWLIARSKNITAS